MYWPAFGGRGERVTKFAVTRKSEMKEESTQHLMQCNVRDYGRLESVDRVCEFVQSSEEDSSVCSHDEVFVVHYVIRHFLWKSQRVRVVDCLASLIILWTLLV